MSKITERVDETDEKVTCILSAFDQLLGFTKSELRQMIEVVQLLTEKNELLCTKDIENTNIISSLRLENKWLKEELHKIKDKGKKEEYEQFNTPKNSSQVVASQD